MRLNATLVFHAFFYKQFSYATHLHFDPLFIELLSLHQPLTNEALILLSGQYDWVVFV